MSRNQKAPLLAFVLVALVCGLVLVDSVRGDASGPSTMVSPPPQNPLTQLVPTPPAAGDGVPAETNPAPSAGQPDLPDPRGDVPLGANAASGPVGEGDLAATQQEAVSDPGAGAAGSAPANSMGDAGPGSGFGPGQAQVDPPASQRHPGHPGHPGGPDHPGRPDNPGRSHGAGGNGQDGAPGLVRKAKKNPRRGPATLGPDAERTEIDPDDPEPAPETGGAPDADGPHKLSEEPGDPAPATQGPAPSAEPSADPGPEALPIDPERGMQEQIARGRAEADH